MRYNRKRYSVYNLIEEKPSFFYVVISFLLEEEKILIFSIYMYVRYTFYFFHFSSPFYSGPQKDAEKSPNHGTYFDFALGISYKVLFPVLDRPTAQFKTACTKFRNVIELSTDIVKQI